MGIKDIIRKTESGADNNAKPPSKKTDAIALLDEISGILNTDDTEIVITRGRTCEVLYANSIAKERMQTADGQAIGCKAGFAKYFPGICDHCPNGGKIDESAVESFEIEYNDGQAFEGKSKTINWIDGKSAVIILIRNITAEKEAKEQLFNMAYIDQLTGVPNRQKLRSDFAELENDIEKNRISGVVALFDLDNFKMINDTYGHNTGDVILRRLTDHLEADKDFSGHLYRLGGDEFVLLYADGSSVPSSEEEMKDYYEGIFSKALRAYTLPNIDLKCTLSMGVSLFPKYGRNLSEVLRKADIALYKAKSEGRNRIVFFEDHYDTSQKFKDLYIYIQPILLNVGKTFGYELLDRGLTGDEAEETLTLDDYNRTLDALGLHDITNNLQYFISYTKQLLNPVVFRNLPREKFVIQINIPPEYTKEDILGEIKIFSTLKKNNYKLAFSGLNSNTLVPELLNVADYCKFSILDRNLDRRKALIASNPKVRFIATDVDTANDFNAAKETGFHMYQGYYFNQPVVGTKTKEISPLKVNYFRLLKLSSAEDYLDFREISSIISSDVALSYKLLRILNSAAVGLRNISSVTSAVAYMGEENLKKWIAVLALRGIAEDKPLEIVRMSLIRARFGELLAPKLRVKRNPQQIFLVSMLSLIHIALEVTKEQLLEEIPVVDDIRKSLLTKNGVFSDLLRFYENYEYANWDAVSQFVEENRMDSAFVNDAYIASVKWYNDLTLY